MPSKSPIEIGYKGAKPQNNTWSMTGTTTNSTPIVSTVSSTKSFVISLDTNDSISNATSSVRNTSRELPSLGQTNIIYDATSYTSMGNPKIQPNSYTTGISYYAPERPPHAPLNISLMNPQVPVFSQQNQPQTQVVSGTVPRY